MNAKKYDIKICTDIVHGWHSVIKEIYVPELGLYFNNQAVFLGDEKRFIMAHNIEDFDLDDEIVKVLYEYAGLKNKIDEISEEFWKK